MSNIPTGREQRPSPATPEAHERAHDLYTRYARRLRRYLALAVNTDATNLDDACAHAWLKLLETQPREPTVFGWLKCVAEREAWRLHRLDRHAPIYEESMTCAAPEPPHLAFPALLHGLTSLHPRRRELLLLHAAGHTVRELAARDGISEARTRELIYQARLQLAQRTGRSDRRR